VNIEGIVDYKAPMAWLLLFPSNGWTHPVNRPIQSLSVFYLDVEPGHTPRSPEYSNSGN